MNRGVKTMSIKNITFTNFPFVEDWYGEGYKEADLKIAEAVSDKIPEYLKKSVTVDYSLLPIEQLKSELNITDMTEEAILKEQALVDLLRELE